MNTLIISGSPRKDGNTKTFLSIFEKELKNYKISTEFISLSAKKINNNHALSKKIGGPIADAGKTGQLTTINSLIDFYLVNEMIIPSSNYWNIDTGVNKGDILNDKKGISYIKKFAENFAWLMNKVEGDSK